MSRATQIDLLLVPLYDYRTDSLCSGYTVEFYAAGTTTPKNVWTEVGKVTPVTTRTLGSSGTVQVYGDGIYKIVVKDTDDAAVYTWDYVKAQANTFTVQNKSGTYTATADDDVILVNTTAGAVTINVATVAGFTHPLIVKLIAGANNVTIDFFEDEEGDGATTITLTPDTDSATLYPDVTGEAWYRADRFAGLTASMTELNQLDGVTVGGTTAGDIVTINGTQTLTNKTITSPTISSPAITSGGDLQPYTVTVPIGAWNCDVVANKNVASGVAYANVITATAVIFNDDLSRKHHIAFAGDASTAVLEGPVASIYVDNDGGNARAVLYRRSDHGFDNAAFDSTDVNRGYVFFQVVPTFATEYGDGL